LDPAGATAHRPSHRSLREKKLEIIGGVESLFADEATTEHAIRLAARWFDRYLGIDRRLLGHTSNALPRL
jgi:hypothetical protein